MRFASPINEQTRTRLRRVLLVLVGLVFASLASSGLADGAALQEQTARLQARLGQLESREDAKYAEGALEQARRALQTASGSLSDGAAVSRAQQIARASMVLAERQLEHRKVRADLFATQQRLTATRERANAQRRVLEALMRDRASVARDGASP